MLRVLSMSDMPYRQLGSAGLTVSAVGLGCNQIGRKLDLDGTRAVVDAAIDAGVTVFDTADVYGSYPGASEELLGHALKGRRNAVVIATKFGMPIQGATLPGDEARGSRHYIRASVEGSLRRLGTDYIDLYQLHRPDPLTPIEETLDALDEIVREGKVRHIGSSNFAGWQIVDADWAARVNETARFVSAQNEYSLLERGIETDVVPAAEHVGVGVIPFFPLSRGLLTGKYRRGEPAPAGTRLADSAHVLDDADWDVLESLEKFADMRGVGLLDVAIGGLAAQPGVASVITGATRPEQIRANARAVNWRPDALDLIELDDITRTARGD
jgi:aryl-alcohol dehydrogenase-like predicted oxidoreductase